MIKMVDDVLIEFDEDKYLLQKHVYELIKNIKNLIKTKTLFGIFYFQQKECLFLLYHQLPYGGLQLII